MHPAKSAARFGRPMKSSALKVATVGGVLGTVMATIATTMAYASTTVTPSSAVGGAAGTLKDNLLNIAGQVLPYAAILAAVVIGWRLARKFVRA